MPADPTFSSALAVDRANRTAIVVDPAVWVLTDSLAAFRKTVREAKVLRNG